MNRIVPPIRASYNPENRVNRVQDKRQGRQRVEKDLTQGLQRNTQRALRRFERLPRNEIF
jgi:hypothetical protein